jgi:hypothetical protein
LRCDGLDPKTALKLCNAAGKRKIDPDLLGDLLLQRSNASAGI